MLAWQTVIEELTRELDLKLFTASYWTLGAKELAAHLERQKGIRHACEAETLIMMAIAPDLIDVSRSMKPPVQIPGIPTVLPMTDPIVGSASSKKRHPARLEIHASPRRRRASDCWKQRRTVLQENCSMSTFGGRIDRPQIAINLPGVITEADRPMSKPFDERPEISSGFEKSVIRRRDRVPKRRRGEGR